MNTITKRLLSMLVVVAMVLSMSPVITLPAAAAVTNPGAEKIDEIAAWEEANASLFNSTEEVTTEKCPICGAENVVWTPRTNETYGSAWSFLKSGAASTHVYLAGNIEQTAVGSYFADGGSSQVACLYLNNKNITTNGVFYVRNIMSIFGAGTVKRVADSTSEMKSKGMFYAHSSGTRTFNIYGGTYVNEHAFRMFDNESSMTVNIYGGEFSSAAETYYLEVSRDGGSGSLNIYGGTINGGIKMTRANDGVNMYGGTIKGVTKDKAAGDGGAIYMTANTFNMYGGTIEGGKIVKRGGSVYLGGGTFNMSGGEIKNGTVSGDGWPGGNVYMDAGAFNMSGGKIYGGSADNRGGNICADGGTLTITGGEIYDGKTAGSSRLGGNVYTNTTTTISGGKIYNGEASGSGDNLAADSSAVITMTGGEIYDGAEDEVYLNGATMIMTGGTITAKRNASGAGGNAVMVTRTKAGGVGAKMILGGTAVVTTRDANPAKAIRVYATDTANLPTDYLFITNDFVGEAYLGLAIPAESEGLVAGDVLQSHIVQCGTYEDGVMTPGGSFSGKLYVGDNRDAVALEVIAENGALTLGNEKGGETEMDLYKDIADTKERVDAWVANNSGETFTSGYCPVCNKEVTWTAVNPIDGFEMMRESLHYYLSDNVTYTQADQLYTNRDSSKSTCIYLNGKTLTTNNGFRLYGTTNLIGGTGKVVRPADATGSDQMFYDVSTAVTNIYGGTYQENTAKDMIYGNNPASSYTLYGGTYEAAATFFNGYYDSELTTYDAEISAGGLAITTRGSQIVMNGGSITYTGEAALSNNGGVVNLPEHTRTDKTSFTMNGGTISGGNTTGNGGNVYVGPGNTFTMNGGEIKDGSAASGGNVYVAKGSTMTMTGNAVVSGGTATSKTSSSSHNITIDGGTLTMRGDSKVIDKYNDFCGAIFAWNSGTPGIVQLYDNASVGTTPEMAANGIANLIRIYVTTNADNKLEIGAGWAGEAYFYYADGLKCGDTLSDKSVTCAAEGFTGDLYHSGIKAFPVEGAVKLADTLKVVTSEGEQWYLTNAEALAAYKAAEGTKYLKLAGNVTLEIDGDTYLDVATYEAVVSGSGKLYAFSSANDDYVGYGYVKTEGDVDLQTETTINGNRYIAIADENREAIGGYYSVHRFEIKLYAVTLRASSAGMYYKAQYSCDEKLASRISAYGVMLSAECTPGAKTVDELQAGAFSALSDFAEKMAEAENHTVAGTSCALWGIMKTTYSGAENLGRAQNKIYANAYIYVDVDGTSDESDDVILLGDEANAGTQNGVAYSLVDMLKAIDENWADYTEAQQEKVKDFIVEWAGLEGDKAVDWSSCNFTNF